MRITMLFIAAVTASFPGLAVALATTPFLGRPLGFTLGTCVLDSAVLGQMLPFIGSGVLLVGAASLAIGIYLILRRNKR